MPAFMVVLTHVVCKIVKSGVVLPAVTVAEITCCVDLPVKSLEPSGKGMFKCFNHVQENYLFLCHSFSRN